MSYAEKPLVLPPHLIPRPTSQQTPSHSPFSNFPVANTRQEQHHQAPSPMGIATTPIPSLSLPLPLISSVTPSTSKPIAHLPLPLPPHPPGLGKGLESIQQSFRRSPHAFTPACVSASVSVSRQNGRDDCVRGGGPGGGGSAGDWTPDQSVPRLIPSFTLLPPQFIPHPHSNSSSRIGSRSGSPTIKPRSFLLSNHFPSTSTIRPLHQPRPQWILTETSSSSNSRKPSTSTSSGMEDYASLLRHITNSIPPSHSPDGSRIGSSLTLKANIPRFLALSVGLGLGLDMGPTRELTPQEQGQGQKEDGGGGEGELEPMEQLVGVEVDIDLDGGQAQGRAIIGEENDGVLQVDEVNVEWCVLCGLEQEREDVQLRYIPHHRGWMWVCREGCEYEHITAELKD